MLKKKIGALTISSAIALSGVIPVSESLAASSSIVVTEQVVQGQSLKGDIINVDKQKLIAKIKSLFPNQFDSLSEQDFQVSFHSFRPGYETDEVYSLHFFKEVGVNKHISGNFEFAGDDLQLLSFYYNPAEKADALFPPKVTKQEAQVVATKFLEKLNLHKHYQLSEDDVHYISDINRPLTEPVEYQFMFEKLENGIPVQYQNANVTVLGNGVVTQFYGGQNTERATYESATNLITKEDALSILKNGLQIDLRYIIDHDYLNNTAAVHLAYVPEPTIAGIHAKTKELKVGNEFLQDLPAEMTIKMLSSKNGQKRGNPLSKEEAKTLAEKLLKPNEENVRLAIEGIEEIERDGAPIYSIHFMYYSGSSGHGSSLEINKQTGEVLNYSNQNRDFYYNDPQAYKDVKPKLTEAEALNKALEYMNQYAYSNLNQYAYPMEATERSYRKEGNEYYFQFPRVKDGIIVSGNGISISISGEDGELYSLHVNYTDIKQWPDVTKAVEKQYALDSMKENMDVTLVYSNNGFNDPYKLLYAVTLKDEGSYFDAQTGKWQKYSYAGENPANEIKAIEHPWAADELNFLLQANILKVDDLSSFNADRTVTKGEALEILFKSLSHYYPHYVREEKRNQQTFENINSEHPLFDIIERAAEQKILDTSKQMFHAEETLTKEELAFWYARALGLQLVAEQDAIFDMEFTDTADMAEQYKGHIALMNGLGILTKDEKDQFYPKAEVTLAELAVSNVRLAKIAAEMNINNR